MFTAMSRRPVLWLLVLLAPVGGWLVYDWHRAMPDGLLASKEGASRTVSDASPPSPVVERAGQASQSAAAPPSAPVPDAQARAPDDHVPEDAADPVAAPAAAVERSEPGPAPAELPPASSGSAVDWRRLGAVAPGAGPARDTPDLPDESAEAAETAAPAAVAPPAAVVATADPDPPPTPGGSSEEPSTTAGAAVPLPPSFDIVRVERDGRTVVAGRAAPGAEVEVRAGDRVLDRVRASRRGEWVATPVEPLAPGGQELTLAARAADDAPLIVSDQVVVVARPEPPPPQPAPLAAAEPPPPQPAEVAATAAPGEPVAVLLPKDGGGSGRILQAPGRISSDGRLALLVLDYDHAGQVRLSGEGPPGAPLRVYVDNLPSAEVVVPQSGRWTTVLGQELAPGNYSLRLDQLSSEGRPVARLETPFTRVRQPPVAGEAQVDYVIVQPGNSLWRIARRLFGDGFRYVHIYDANQAQIRDPDLIYPGQVFEVPAALGSAG